MCKIEFEVDKTWDVNLTKELLLHIDNLYHQRVNIFLVAEGIFLAAFAALFAGQSDKFVKVVVCLAGLLSALLLWYPLYRLERGFCWLAHVFKKLEATGLYIKYRDFGRGAPSSNRLMAHWLPIGVIIMWVVLFIHLL